MNIIYGVGAAIVILGALAKILHNEYADIMLIVGMVTEAIVFFVSAFDFPEEEYEWERVYPVLADENAQFETVDTSWTNNLNQLDGKVFGQLSSTLQGLNDNVGKLSTVSDAAGATNEYAARIREATTKIENLNQSYAVAVGSMSDFANAATDAQSYHEQVQTMTKNLRSLNSIYELELQDAQTHLKSLNQFYGSMTQAMQNMAEASKDAETYKQGMNQLTNNLNRLNRVYGNILGAMSSGVQ